MVAMQGVEGLDLSVTPYDGCGKCLVGVLRLSEMTDTTNSPDKQVKQNRAVAAENGGHIIAWVQDWDVSGAVNPFVRKGFGPWLRDQMGPYDGISASAVGRIGRDLLDTLMVGRHMTTTGRQIYTYGHDGPWNLRDQNDEQNFTFQALGAQMEHRSIQRRTGQTAENMRAIGRKYGTVAYYYRYVRIGESRTVDHIELDPVPAKVLRTVAQRILADETGQFTVSSEARRLTSEGVPTSADYRRLRKGLASSGAAWGHTALYAMLVSQAALGYLMHDDKPELDHGPDEDKRGRPIRIAPELWNYATHEALVKKLKPTPLPKPRAPKTDHLLIGAAYCGQCGHRLYIGNPTTKANGEKLMVYVCKAKRKGFANAQHCKPAPSITIEQLDRAVVARFLADFGDKPQWEPAFDAGNDTTARLAEVEAELAILRDDRKAGLYNRPKDVEWFQREYKRLSEEAERLEAMPQRPASAYWTPTKHTVADLWHAAKSNRERRELLLSYSMRVEVFPMTAPTRYTITTQDADNAMDAREDSWEAYQRAMVAEQEYRAQVEADQDAAEGIADQDQDVHMPPTPAEQAAEQNSATTEKIIHALTA